MTIAFHDIPARSTDAPVSAAKLQVLGLSPIKSRLGDKWDRLSDLVHRLFEKAIANAQGPNDHFIVLDELSYVVTFGNLSLAQTRLMCGSIAREVCEHLFGDKIDDVSVRSLVAEVAAPTGTCDAQMGADLEALLERAGVETIVSHAAQSPTAAPAVECRPNPMTAAMEPILAAHALLAQKGLKLGFFPVWELKKGTSNSLFLTSFTGNGVSCMTSGTVRLLGSESQIVDLEISQLYAAEAYAARIRQEGKICALSVGVSYSTLSCFRSRIRYMAALEKAVFSPSSPLLVRIEQIPEGAPQARIAEFAAMLASKKVRATLEFCSLASTRGIDIRLGVAAMGGTLPSGLDPVLAQEAVERLVQRSMGQKAFAFLENIDSPERLALASRAGIRAGRGLALSGRYFSGLDPIPAFPLSLPAKAAGLALV